MVLNEFLNHFRYFLSTIDLITPLNVYLAFREFKNTISNLFFVQQLAGRLSSNARTSAACRSVTASFRPRSTLRRALVGLRVGIIPGMAITRSFFRDSARLSSALGNSGESARRHQETSAGNRHFRETKVVRQTGLAFVESGSSWKDPQRGRITCGGIYMYMHI